MKAVKSIREMLDIELRAHPEVSYTIEQGRKHLRVWLRRDHRQMFVTMSVSPSDARALKNQKRDVRRVLQTLTA